MCSSLFCVILPNTEQFYFKYQCRETWDRTTCFRAITHFGWDIDDPLVAYMHLLEGDLPSVYHIAKAESFGTIALVRIIKLLAIYQRSSIVDTHDASDGRRDLAFAVSNTL